LSFVKLKLVFWNGDALLKEEIPRPLIDMEFSGERSQALGQAFSCQASGRPTRMRGRWLPILNSPALSGVEKDGPFDNLGWNQNTCLLPWVTAKQGQRFFGITGFQNDENTTGVSVRPSQYDSPLLKQAVHEYGVFIPERLLPSRHLWYPRWSGITKYEKERAHVRSTFHVQLLGVACESILITGPQEWSSGKLAESFPWFYPI